MVARQAMMTSAKNRVVTEFDLKNSNRQKPIRNTGNETAAVAIPLRKSNPMFLIIPSTINEKMNFVFKRYVSQILRQFKNAWGLLGKMLKLKGYLMLFGRKQLGRPDSQVDRKCFFTALGLKDCVCAA